MHEASLHEDNCFLTLTYDDEHLPKDLSVDVRHFQLFMKRYRKKCGKRIRFFHCGEYGRLNGRPHYHAIIFNHTFSDKKIFKRSKDHPIFTSDTLDTLWGMGHASIGTVTFESAAYVARYVVDKITGDKAADHYTWIDPKTGEVHQRKPEYITMSRNGGIGSQWWKKYNKDVTTGDFVVMRGKKMRPPKAYDRAFKEAAPKEFRETRGKRVRLGKLQKDNNTKRRLAVREKVQLARLNKLPRNLED